MNSDYIIGWMIAVFVLLLFFVIFSKPLKFVGSFCINAIIGLSALFAVNYFTAATGVFVGINIYTAFFSGILGLPGVICLYLIKFLLL